MSRFYGSMQGNRGEATRQGTAKSGISAHIRGWNIGISVECHIDENGHDVCIAYKTSGSNDHVSSEHIITVTE